MPIWMFWSKDLPESWRICISYSCKSRHCLLTYSCKFGIANSCEVDINYRCTTGITYSCKGGITYSSKLVLPTAVKMHVQAVQ